MITHGLFIAFLLRMSIIGKERDDEGFSTFSRLFLIGGLLVVLAAVIVFAYSLFPITYVGNFKFTAWVRNIHSVVLSMGCIVQIIAYIQVYTYGKKGETEVAKILHKCFGKAPIFLIIGNSIAIISYVLSYIVGGAFHYYRAVPNSIPSDFCSV